jgi:zinc protease
MLFSAQLAGVLACAAPRAVPAPPLGTSQPIAAVPERPSNVVSVPRVPVQRVQDEKSPVVVLRLMFESGSAQDPPRQRGLTQLTARLLLQASRRLNAAQLARAWFPLGTQPRVHVDRQTTVFSLRVHHSVAPRALELMLETLTQPRLDADDLERLRRDQHTWLTQGLPQDDDEELGKEALHATLWEGHPYAHPPDGALPDVDTLTLEDVQRHAAEVFVQKRLVAALGGQLQPAWTTLVETTLARLPAGAPAVAVPTLPPSPADGLRVVLVEKATDSTPLTCGMRWDMNRAHPDFVPLMVANSALGEHRTPGGRFFVRMREQRGLTYGAYTYLEHFEEDPTGLLPRLNVPWAQQLFMLWVRPVAAADAAFALRLMMAELERVSQAGITPQEFERARDFLGGYSRFHEEGLARRVGWLLDDGWYRTPGFLAQVRQRLTTVTLAEVNAAWRTHVHPGALTCTWLTADAQGVRERLLSGASTPRGTRVVGRPADPEHNTLAAHDLALRPNRVTVVPLESLFGP